MVAPTHLKSFQALVHASQLGSLKKAADALSITPAAVGQRVKALETYLGVELLLRGRTGLQPSPALAAALPRLVAAFSNLEAATEILDMHRGQEIHVGAPSDIVELWLKPRLPGFTQNYPGTSFCINGEGDAPLRLGQIDCEIRFGPGQSQFDPLFPDYVVPVSSPVNQERIARQPRRTRLEGFPLLHLDFYRNDQNVPDWGTWIRRQRLRRTAPERGMRFQRVTDALDAVLADAGLTLGGMALLSGMLDQKKIGLPFGIASGVWTHHVYQMRFRPESLKRPPVRQFRRWLIERGAETQQQLIRLVGK